MKRYSLTCGYCKTGGASTWKEDPNGEWVTWEDVKEILQYKDYLKGYTICTCDNAPCVCHPEINLQPECNCEYELERREGFVSNELRSWICPAHGYKKRGRK